MSFVRDLYRLRGVPEGSIDIILNSWSDATKKQYTTYINKWIVFAKTDHISVTKPSINDVLNFLQKLVDNGLKYSGVNTAKSVLIAIFVLDDRNHYENALINRFLKGVFKTTQPSPRYSSTWDVNLVLDFFRKQPPVECLSLLDLSLKLVTLMSLATAQRQQSLQMLDLENMVKEDDKFTFFIVGNFKHARPKFPQQNLVFPVYEPDERLCVYSTLAVYLERTGNLRTNSKLLISTVKPYSAVTRDTVSRWLKTVLSSAGIDTQIFKAHSFRAATTSTALLKGVNIKSILETAGWANAKTFEKFYLKPVVIGEKMFAHCVLD